MTLKLRMTILIIVITILTLLRYHQSLSPIAITVIPFQGIKKEMKRIITLIKELHMQASGSKIAAQTASKVQALIEEKREAMAGAAARLDERERKER